MAASPVWAATPRYTSVTISTANTNRDGSGTLTTCFAAGSSGSVAFSCTIFAHSTTTAGMVRLYHYDGTNTYCFAEIPVSAITPSGTVQAFKADVNLADFGFTCPLPANHAIKASTHNAETFAIHIRGGDL